MSNVAIAETSKPKKGPKVLKRLELEPKMGGGHTVTHYYTDYAHEPMPVPFNAEGKREGKGGGEHIMSHLTKHAGLPAMSGKAGESTPAEDEEES